MTSVNLGKTLEFLYYLWKGIYFMFFSTLKEIIQTQSKTIH